jgi:hypothetical protein
MKYDEPLSDVAFSFNLRQYIRGKDYDNRLQAVRGRAVQVDSTKISVESAFGCSA